jgi:hypothetical protein
MQDPKLWTFWCWGLMKASHKKHKQIIRDVMVELEPGEFIMGRKAAAKELKMTERGIRTCLSKLLRFENVTTRTTNRFTVVSVVNWHTYQQPEEQSDQQNDQQVASRWPAPDHEQECKKGRSIDIRQSPGNGNGGAGKATVSAKAAKPKIPYREIVDCYNDILGGDLPRVKIVHSKRELAIRKIWHNNQKMRTLDKWESFFKFVASNGFLMGREKDWRADFDWLVKEENFAKVVEGKYN